LEKSLKIFFEYFQEKMTQKDSISRSKLGHHKSRKEASSIPPKSIDYNFLHFSDLRQDSFLNDEKCFCGFDAQGKNVYQGQQQCAKILKKSKFFGRSFRIVAL